MKKLVLYISAAMCFVSCVAQKPLSRRTPLANFLADTNIARAHSGVCVYDVDSKQFLVRHQDAKYFVPASNVKIVTTYAVMKYLKHILPGIRYFENDTAVYLVPTGDPTLLHRDFKQQPVIKFLQTQNKKIYITDKNWKDAELGNGWSWDDYNDEYMAERNALPVYGNVLRWVQEKIQSQDSSAEQSFSVYSDPEVNWKVRFETDPLQNSFKVTRDRLSNTFVITQGLEKYAEAYVPFITSRLGAALELLPDTIHKRIGVADNFLLTDPQQHTIPSHPTDSVLRPMMYRSDNFLAEQLLLMVADQRIGVMDVRQAIDTLLDRDLAFLPDTPVWVDGSGMSRYNLFTPRTMVSLLDSMRREFGMERMKGVFPTGDSGTLKGYYVADNGYVYAKTGSMSGVVCLSGYLYTGKKRLLAFSVMVNNFTGKSVFVRRAIERLVRELRTTM